MGMIQHEETTPYKFSFPHVLGRFSSNGMLVKVLPNSPREGSAALIEFHDLNTLLSDLPSAQELKFFPGAFHRLISRYLFVVVVFLVFGRNPG